MFQKTKRKVGATGFRVLLKPDPLVTKTASGIQLAVDEKLYRAATTIGTIIDIGPTAWKGFDDGTPWAKVGDRVYYAKYAGKEIVDGSEDGLVMINDEDVLGIVVEEETE